MWGAKVPRSAIALSKGDLLDPDLSQNLVLAGVGDRETAESVYKTWLHRARHAIAR